MLTNYNVTNAGAAFTINARNATWTTTAASKTYGDLDPVPVTTGSGDFLAADGVSATYSRVAGETVVGGPYAITATLSTAGVLTNYNVTNAGAAFTINARDATWTTTPASKTYGDLDPVPVTTGSGDFLAADGVRRPTAGWRARPWSADRIRLRRRWPGGRADELQLTNAGAAFTINARNATWTTTRRARPMGILDPVQVTTGSGGISWRPTA